MALVAAALAIMALGYGAIGSIHERQAETDRRLAARIDSFAVAYPDWRVTKTGDSWHILQHRSLDALSIEVRYLPRDTVPPWYVEYLEPVPGEWMTTDTFFRHAKDRPPDPRTGMNYDIEGFAAEYEKYKPRPESLLLAVSLDEPVDSDGFEMYDVWAVGRDPGDTEWIYFFSVFSRDSRSGEWEGGFFERGSDDVR